MFFLRTNPTANCRQSTRAFQHGCRLQKFPSLNIFHESGNINTHGTTFHTSRGYAIHTTGSLPHSHIGCQSLIHLDTLALDTFFRCGFRHMDTLNRSTFLPCHLLTQFLTPRFVPITHAMRMFRILLFYLNIMQFGDFGIFKST